MISMMAENVIRFRTDEFLKSRLLPSLRAVIYRLRRAKPSLALFVASAYLQNRRLFL
jgi:hypothetical protein